MIDTYTPEQLAEKYGHLTESEDPVRWFKRRLFDGRIPGKRLSRNIVVMTDKHIDLWLHGDEPAPAANPAVMEDSPAEPIVGILTSVSNRRRIKVASAAAAPIR